MKEDRDFVTITNKDIYKELVRIGETVTNVLLEQKATNGRVTKLENKSIGIWVSNHPYKFGIYLVLALSLLSNEARDTVFNLVKSLI